MGYIDLEKALTDLAVETFGEGYYAKVIDENEADYTFIVCSDDYKRGIYYLVVAKHETRDNVFKVINIESVVAASPYYLPSLSKFIMALESR